METVIKTIFSDYATWSNEADLDSNIVSTTALLNDLAQVTYGPLQTLTVGRSLG